jgi:hypothetical protein
MRHPRESGGPALDPETRRKAGFCFLARQQIRVHLAQTPLPMRHPREGGIQRLIRNPPTRWVSAFGHAVDIAKRFADGSFQESGFFALGARDLAPFCQSVIPAQAGIHVHSDPRLEDACAFQDLTTALHNFSPWIPPTRE